MKKYLMAVLVFVVMFLFVSDSNADKRNYVWTYEYKTMPKGKFEVEYYLTEEQKYIHKSKPSIWKHWVELEYGITNNWDISMYQQFKQSNTAASNKFEYDGFKFRTRYRIGKKNQLPLDTLVYLEYIRDDNWDRPNVLEEKLVLAKDIGRLNVSYNQIFKQELESRGKAEYEYAAGLSYKISSPFNVGVESKGNYTSGKYYFGPTVSWATSRFWVSAGTAFGMSSRADDLQARLIVGIPF